MCDKYLAKRAGIHIEPPEEIPAYLQVCAPCLVELAVADSFTHQGGRIALQECLHANSVLTLSS